MQNERTINMDKMKSWVEAHKKLIAYIAAGAVLICAAFLIYRHFHQPEPVTTESQTQAETPAGVEQAADRAHVPISNDQAQQAASQIKYIYSHDVQPIYTITTTGSKAQKAAETAQNNAGADFSIITNKSNPTATTDLKTLPAGSTVELNQYNVQAYKKVLHTVDISSDIDAAGVSGINEVGYTVSRKVTGDGKYIGVGASYNIDDHKTMVKLSYTW